MKHHELVYLVILCVAPNLFLWCSLLAWALFMTGSTWLGTVKRLKKLIGIWIGALGHCSGCGEEAGQAKQQLCQVGQRPAEGSSSAWQEAFPQNWLPGYLTGTGHPQFGEGRMLDTSRGAKRSSCFRRETRICPKMGRVSTFTDFDHILHWAEGNEWRQGSSCRCDMVWAHLSSRAVISTTEMRTSENYCL